MESNGLDQSGRSERDNRENWSGRATLGEGGTAHDAHQLLESVLPPKCLWRRETSNTAPANTAQSVQNAAGRCESNCGPCGGQIRLVARLKSFSRSLQSGRRDVAALCDLGRAPPQAAGGSRCSRCHAERPRRLKLEAVAL